MSVISLLLSVFLAVAPPPAGGGRPRDPKAFGAVQLVVLHYARPDNAYEGWNLWAWPEGKDGAQVDFSGTDAFGRVAVVPLKQKAGRVGFIVRKGNWEQKDFDGDRFVDTGGRPVTEAWIVSGDPDVHPQPPTVDRTLKVYGAFLDARDRITLATSVPLDAGQQSRLTLRRAGGGMAPGITSAHAAKVPGAERPITSVVLAAPVADADIAHLSLEIPGCDAVTVYARGVLDDPAFIATEEELGPRCTKSSTVLSTWSPVADRVQALLFDDPSAANPSRTVDLRRGPHGTWSADVPGDLHGTAYLLRFQSYGKERTCVDIRAHAATADSGRGILVDLDRVQPDGWDASNAPIVKRMTDEVLYEVHVRDFSVADDSCTPEHRGTYLGLVHGGEVASRPTGLAYLRALGITTVHLMPVQDFTAPPDAYNWGYWTALFDVPEGNYASDKRSPFAPILELRTAIQGLHAAGLRVVLDVVYNHTSSSGEGSPFDQTVPYWFFRTTADGRYANDAGCGNSVADERPMVRRYILDSLSFWLQAYKVDGFRFDLLGTFTPETAKAICTRLRALRPDATLYGEPWTGGGPVRFGKGAQKGLPIAVFNDDFRNAVRGDTDGTAPGFATGSGGNADAVRRGVAGSIDGFAKEPAESINYVSAHDNLTLVDKIAKSAPAADAATRRAMQKLALGIVLASQGVPFIEGGSELCRTKGGNHNSYEAGDAVNRYDWAVAAQCTDVADWVAGMIAVRRAHPAFRLSDDADVRRAIAFLPNTGSVIAWTIDGRVAKDPARRILVALNGQGTPAKVSLPPGQWSVLVDAAKAGPVPHATLKGSADLPPESMLVAVQAE